MILRKPFAILIKNFKLIHAILTVLSFYLLYRTNVIINFFKEYMSTSNSVIGNDLTGELYNPLMYISLFIVIIGTLIITALMVFKKKKIKLYIYNILTYIFVIIVYAVTHSILKSLEIELVDIRTLKMIQDLLTTIFILQIASFFLYGMRATGFDVKKFDFKRDLQELEIEENDDEEFEVNVDFSSDETKRKIHRAIRHTKYIYKENKYILLIIAGILVAIASITTYININVYNKVYKKGDAFTTNYFTMSLSDSYSTNEDYKGNKILETKESLLVVKLKLKNNTNKEMKFEPARLLLNIDEHYFTHDINYNKAFDDIGNVYINQNISNEFLEYTFVYKVPTDFLDKKIILSYSDYNEKDIRMKVEPISLDKKIEQKQYKLGTKIELKDSIIPNINIQINNVELSTVFRVDYNFCIKEQCYPSYEYIKPEINSNNRKGLVKITGEITDDTNKYNLYKFIKNFGTIEYQILGQTKKVDLITRKKPIKTNTSDNYIEIPEEAVNAEKIDLVFKIRNKIYKYTIK